MQVLSSVRGHKLGADLDLPVYLISKFLAAKFLRSLTHLPYQKAISALQYHPRSGQVEGIPLSVSQQ